MTLRPRSAGTDLPKALAFVVAFAVVTAVLVGFVRLKSLQVEAGYRVHDLRMRLVTLDQQRAALEVERAALARPQRIAHFARTQLGLVHAEATIAAPPPAKGFATKTPPTTSTTTSSTATTSTGPTTGGQP
jgi:cell division protein FtsL